MKNSIFTIREEALWHAGAFCDDMFVLDVRTPAEFQEAHIPGSTNIPLGDLRRRAPEILERSAGQRITLVCLTGRLAESAHEQLQGEGHSDLHVLEGGIASWLQAGLPANRGRTAFSLERQVRIAAGMLVVLGVLLGFLLHQGFFGFSALVGAGLAIAGITDTCGMAMILAKMPWNRALVASDKD